MKIEIHSEALKELNESVEWYLAKSGRAAQDFALEVENAIEDIRRNPQRFPLLDKKHRSYRVARFPYHIIFRSDAERILIIAIAHAKRRPGFWKERATDEDLGNR